MTPRRSPFRLLALLALLGLLVPLCLAGPAAGSVPPATAGTDPVGVWPLHPEPAVARSFDPPADPWGAGHRGVDLRGSPGQQVRAALPGQVTWAGVLAGRGVVVVGHGATRTTYEPVEATVGVGDAVAAGDPLGTLPPVGSHCLPAACLHWGWIEGETYLDPLRLVGGGPVRLLPLWRDLPAGASAPSAAPAAAPTVARMSAIPLPYAPWRPLMRLLGLGDAG